MNKRNNREYDAEFKHNVVKLYASGKSYSVLSDGLGILMATLVGWIHSGKYKTSGNNAGGTIPVTARYFRL